MTCPACVNENAVEQRETAWLIENGRQEWWDGRVAGVYAVFTKDHSEAMRFARFEDAERARCWLLQPITAHLRSTEHVWMSNGR